MSFPTVVFGVFLAVVLALWHLLPFRYAKVALFAAGLVFYAYWFPPYVLLLLATTTVDYVAAQRMPRSRHPGRYLAASITVNVGVLVLFKYLDFIVGAFRQVDDPVLGLILPIGLSFYSFEAISYIVDVYTGRTSPAKNVVDYFLYISFFPHLVAGPIVRADAFLPQLDARRTLVAEDVAFGLYRITRGFFLKVAIADNISPYADKIFARDPATLAGPEAWLGALFFAVQIFADFAGYSDIAIGTARLFGIRILENFRNPYLARGLEDFWRRWHVSLSTWFRDYVYIPLGGNRRGELRRHVNLIVVFAVSGLWHGANWTFLLWGVAHGIGLTVERMLRDRLHALRLVPGLWSGPPAVALTFVVVVFLWVPFRAADVGQTLRFWRAMLDPAAWSVPFPLHLNFAIYLAMFLPYLALAAIRERRESVSMQLWYTESLAYWTATLLVPGVGTDFIYFQF
jgi:alginate O-acetyltransferase complex protein AlgI